MWLISAMVLACGGSAGAADPAPVAAPAPDVAAAPAPAVAPAAAPASDAAVACAGEQTFFACMTAKGKRIEVCGHAGSPGAVFYRFGKPGAAELTFPTDLSDSVGKFVLEERSYVQSSAYELAFSNADVSYLVVESSGAGGAGAETNNFAGVTVSKDDKQLASLGCESAVQSDWDALRALLPAATP